MHTLALLGTAHIHTPSFCKKLAEDPGIEVKYVYDPDPAVARERAEDTGGEVVDSPEVVLKDDAVESVVICSQTSLHESLVLPAAAAGKHMFVEKPLGMLASDAKTMADAIDEAGVIFQTGYFMRGGSKVRYLKDRLAGGDFGRVNRVRMTNVHNGVTGRWLEPWEWMLDPNQCGVGGFGDLGTHILDVLLWWLEDGMGDRAVAATGSLGSISGRHDDIDEFGEALVRFESGCVASLAAGWVEAGKGIRSITEVSGTGAHAYDCGDLRLRRESDEKYADVTDLPEAMPHAFDLFLSAVKGETPAMDLVKPSEAARRNTVMDAIYEGARGGTWAEIISGS